jgi:F-type H+-transporting ATPase subunit epsilon
MHLHVTVVTGDRAVYDGLADCVVAPAMEGQISVLLHHASLIAALEPGGLLVRLGPAEQSFAVGGGFIEVRDDEVIILADTAERAEEIDIARAEAARRRARALVKMYRDRPESAAAWQALRRSRVRIQVAQRIKK